MFLDGFLPPARDERTEMSQCFNCDELPITFSNNEAPLSEMRLTGPSCQPDFYPERPPTVILNLVLWLQVLS